MFRRFYYTRLNRRCFDAFRPSCKLLGRDSTIDNKPFQMTRSMPSAITFMSSLPERNPTPNAGNLLHDDVSALCQHSQTIKSLNCEYLNLTVTHKGKLRSAAAVFQFHAGRTLKYECVFGGRFAMSDVPTQFKLSVIRRLI